MATAVEPPPGLSLPRQQEGGTTTTTSHSSLLPSSLDQDGDVRHGSDGDRAALTYSRPFMLALSKSPLVSAPSSMPPLSQWYGDWEAYHPRFQHHAPHSPMGNFVKADKYHKERHGPAGGLTGASLDDGLEGGMMSGYAGRRGERFRKGDGPGGVMEYAGNSRKDGNASRFSQTGKNPFGQVSASGAFKPAGRELGHERFGTGAMGRIGGRDRDALTNASFKQAGAAGGLRSAGGRRGEVEDETGAEGMGDGGMDDTDWESVPRSPEADRRNRHAADSASDWRRATGGGIGSGGGEKSVRASQGGKFGALGRDRDGSGPGAYGSGPGVGRKTSFPAWMADDSEPAWMAEGGGSSSLHDGHARRDGGAAGAGGAFDEHKDINVDDVDVTGLDSIQAFKARMKERERRARERELGISSNAGISDGGNEVGHASQIGDASESSHAALFDNFASSAKERAQAKQQQDDSGVGDSSTGSIEMPGRTSRFARFFDGKPQATAIQAQQRQMELLAAGAQGSPSQEVATGVHPVAPTTPQKTSVPNEADSNVQGASVSMADLFRSMSVNRQQQQHQQQQQQQHQQQEHHSPGLKVASPPPPPPGLKRDPSDADVQGMQKIMALLSGGGSGVGRGDENGPPPPPGLFSKSPSIRQQQPGDSQSHGSPQANRQHIPNEDGQSQGQVHNLPHHHHQPPPPAHMQGWHGQQPLYGPGPPGNLPPPGFGLDPRLLAAQHHPAGPQSPSGMPQPNGPGSPMHGHGPPPRLLPQGFGPLPPGMRPPPLPPQLQQQLVGLPPQVQHQLISQHFMMNNGPHPPPPPPHHHLPPPQMMYGGARPMFGNPSSPMGGGEGAHSGSEGNGQGAAQLMALLGHGSGNGKAT